MSETTERADVQSSASGKGLLPTLLSVLKTARPRQWVKNLLVLIAPVAAFGSDVKFNVSDVAVNVAIAFVAFSLAASSVYLVNDARDVEADRQHPTKRFRPIAAGVAPAATAPAVPASATLALAGAVLVTAPISVTAPETLSPREAASSAAANASAD